MQTAFLISAPAKEQTEGPIFGYACNEGNYAMTDSLAGDRTDEKKAASK